MLPNGVAPNVLPLTSNSTMRLPVVDAWNFTLEHQFTPSTVFSIGYVGNKGYHVTPGGTNYNINQPSIVGFGTLTTNQRRLFYQKFGWTQSIKYFSDDASVKFNSLQVRGEKRFGSGLQLQGNFTWASAFDFSNDYFFWNHDIDYGRENGVRRFVFNFNGFYELPFGKNKHFLKSASRVTDLFLGGWQIAGLGTWESGIPFTPSYVNCGSDEDTGPCRANLVGSAEYVQPERRTAGSPPRPPGTSGQGCLNYCHRHAAAECQRLHARSLEPPGRRHVRQRHPERILRTALLQHRCFAEQEVPVHQSACRASSAPSCSTPSTT